MTLVVFVPSVFALGLLFFPRGKEEAMRWWSLIGTALTLGAQHRHVLQLPATTSSRANGVIDTAEPRDGPSLPDRAEAADTHAARRSQQAAATGSPATRGSRTSTSTITSASTASAWPLVLLTTALCFLAMIASWKIDKFVRGYCMLFLMLETGMLGTFLALDFFLFYIFWEVMLLPMYFLIGVWGGPRREYAAIKFFLYTLLGSVFILIALLAFYFTNVRDFVTPSNAWRPRPPNQDDPRLDTRQTGGR